MTEIEISFAAIAAIQSKDEQFRSGRMVKPG
jgi:hypothetical protein